MDGEDASYAPQDLRRTSFAPRTGPPSLSQILSLRAASWKEYVAPFEFRFAIAGHL